MYLCIYPSCFYARHRSSYKVFVYTAVTLVLFLPIHRYVMHTYVYEFEDKWGKISNFEFKITLGANCCLVLLKIFYMLVVLYLIRFCLLILSFL